MLQLIRPSRRLAYRVARSWRRARGRASAGVEFASPAAVEAWVEALRGRGFVVVDVSPDWLRGTPNSPEAWFELDVTQEPFRNHTVSLMRIETSEMSGFTDWIVLWWHTTKGESAVAEAIMAVAHEVGAKVEM